MSSPQRVVDRRIRTVARAIDYPYRSFRSIHPGIEMFRAACERGLGRHLAVAAAVRVLEALDADLFHRYLHTPTRFTLGAVGSDLIDQWNEDTDGCIGFAVEGWVELPLSMRDDPPDRVQVTVRRMP